MGVLYPIRWMIASINMYMMHQPTPDFVWYIVRVIDGERWYFVRIKDGGRCWSKNVTKGKFWRGLVAAKVYAAEHFATDDVVVGGKARLI